MLQRMIEQQFSFILFYLPQKMLCWNLRLLKKNLKKVFIVCSSTYSDWDERPPFQSRRGLKGDIKTQTKWCKQTYIKTGCNDRSAWKAWCTGRDLNSSIYSSRIHQRCKVVAVVCLVYLCRCCWSRLLQALSTFFLGLLTNGTTFSNKWHNVTKKMGKQKTTVTQFHHI